MNQEACDLSIRFCGLKLNSPIVLLSGCVGFGEDYPRIQGWSNRDIGAVILKGTTLSPRLGNPPPRIYEAPSGLLNAIGLQNPGARKVVEEILPRLPHDETHFWANINGSTVEEYAEVARIFDDSPVTAIEINISCPNVKAGGVHFGHDPTMAAQVVSAARKATRKPLITKLSPNNTNITAVTAACIDAGTDALAAINTVIGMAVDVERQRAVLANVSGGLSGPAIKPIALWKIHQIRPLAAKHGIPIIGQGGIANARDALEFALVGSNAIGLGTGLFYDPLLPAKILDGIRGYLVNNGMKAFHEVVGKLSP